MTDAVDTVATGVRRILDSGAKIMRRKKNRDSNATAQQDDASTTVQQDVTSMTVNTQSINTPERSESGVNTAQECGAMNPDASFLLELGSRTPQFGTNTANEFSPIGNQVASPTQGVDPSGINISAPPRPDSSGNDMPVTGMDLLDAQSATASNDSVVGTHVPAPSPRQSMQSPVTHQLQQTLCNSASEQVHMCDHSSPSHSQDNGDGASPFSAFDTNNNPTIVETVQEGNSVDGDGYPIGEGHVGNLSDDARVNLNPRQSGVFVDPRTVCDSGLRSLAIDTAENLVIDANDPGRADFVTSAGALGKASGAPLDGLQHVSFGEKATNRGNSVDGNNGDDGIAHSGSDSSRSCDTPSGFDPCDPDALADLLTAPPKPDARSPASTQFNEHPLV